VTGASRTGRGGPHPSVGPASLFTPASDADGDPPGPGARSRSAPDPRQAEPGARPGSAPGPQPGDPLRDGAAKSAPASAPTVPARRPAAGRRGPRTSLAVRITAACLLVAVVAVGAAGLVAVRLVAVTARSVTQDVLAQQADVVAAQLGDTGAALRAAGMRRVVEVLGGQGVTVVVVTARGPRNPGALAPVLDRADVTKVLTGQPVSTQVTAGGLRYLVEARPSPVGGFALVRTTDTGPLGNGVIRRNLAVALLVGMAVAVVVGAVVGQLLARPLRRTAVAARTLRSGRRDVRVPVGGPAEVSDVAGAVNELADALARSEQRQRMFLLSVSHELRTPLTAVRGFAESLADGVVTGDDAADAGRVIVREADRLDRLVGDLMELARLEADDFPLDPVPVDLAALAADAATVWSARCDDAGVRFVLQAGPTAVVRADPRRLRQVVDGLAENALRVTPRGSPLVVATGGDAASAWLQVRDGGPGLAPEDYPVVFERGVLHDRYRGRRPVGSGGVGLALVHGLVVRMGATIRATPGPEGGACFTVTFPARGPAVSR
jgi:two-component system, OmpR family, sensor kinase